MKHLAIKLTAGLCAAVLGTGSLPVSADSTSMKFRLSAENTYLKVSKVAEGDQVIHSGMYIDNYAGISAMRLCLKSDDPIVIENGDFTRDPNRTEIEVDEETGTQKQVPKQCYFKEHGTAYYNQYSPVTGRRNTVTWESANYMKNGVGEVENPDSSFLNFDVRIPKDTPAGVYKCYITTERYDAFSDSFYVFRGSETITNQVELIPLVVTVEPNALRGDVNCDGIVNVDDAQRALMYSINQLAGTMDSAAKAEEILGTPFIHTAEEAADVQLNNDITANDAQIILMYYLAGLAGQEQSWDALLK